MTNFCLSDKCWGGAPPPAPPHGGTAGSDSDVSSETSSISSEQDLLDTTNYVIRQDIPENPNRRKYRTETQKLRDALPRELNRTLPKLRSNRN